jgi:DNA-binding transcriptional regulator YhcF (GntR family)
MSGWIKIDRNISTHWIWKDDTKLKWWLDMLITVNFRANKILVGNKLIECNRGQSIMSLQQWATRWKVDKNKVRNFFVLLEKDGMITHENLSKTTRITICNYETYQDIENANETQLKRKRNAIKTQTNPIEEGKELEEGKKENNYIPDSPYGDGRLHLLCREHAKENPGKYSKEMYIGFLEYWTAPVQTGPKKGKELWTTEKTFQLSSRLSTNYKLFWEGKGNKSRDTSKSIFG